MAPVEGYQQSTPDVPGYAIAYTPKDPPSTPAVVIAPEAQSAREHEPPAKKREFSQTMPSRVRSAPNASVAPLPPPPSAALPDDFNPYARKQGKGKVIGLGLGGALLLLGAVALVRTSGSGNHALPTQAAGPRTDVVPLATPVATTPTPTPAESKRLPPTVELSAALPAPIATTAAPRTSEAAPAKSKAKPKAKAESASAATRPVTRVPVAASEPSPPPRPAGKSVIVRDAPF